MGSSINQNDSSESPTVLLRRLHHWRMAFFGVVILLAGMLGGTAATLLAIGYMGSRNPPPPVRAVKMLLERLSGPLHLTAEQRRQAEPILQKHVARLDQIQQDGQKAIQDELRLLSEEMGALLTQDQMGLWEQFFLELPGAIRHIPQERGPGPGLGRGPAPGPGGWRGPPGDRRGPFHTPSHLPAPDANAAGGNG
jgi:hypothetical protein